MAEQFTQVRGEMAEQSSLERQHTQAQFGELRAEMRRDNRHTLTAMITVTGILTGIIIAFLQYRLPA